ncbi:MAG TPA: HEAT repeat domain-containing protein [Aggregatilineaceae bacterium]|nr:HEAT repeat domain-containing protein [Aggregatilineaceae bacterium]
MAIDVWLQKLKSPDPAVRAASIRELELLGSPEALSALADVFATDPDPELRTMAQAAGKMIYYAAIRRSSSDPGSSEEERQRAADILAQARAKKFENQRKK